MTLPQTLTFPRPAGKVADRIAATLAAWGVRFAFGIPGNDVLETVRACEEAGIRFVLAKSEPAAAFMADAVAQLTGRPAVLIPALGPGVANATAGIAGAQQERTPLIVLAGEMVGANHGIYTHQVFDHVALAAPITKYAATLNPERAGQQLAKALDIATAYPAGPVLLNIPADAGRLPATEKGAVPRPARRALAGLTPAEASRLRKLVAAARRPLALIGRGALAEGVPGPLGGFLDAWRMPALVTYKAKGIVDDDDPSILGSVGLSPVIDAESSTLIGEADLVVAIGFDPIELRDAWIDAWPVEKACIALDWGPVDHRMFPTPERAFGDLPTLLAQLVPDSPAWKTGWSADRLAAYRTRVSHIVRPRTPHAGISPAALFGAVSKRVTASWIMTVDVGAHRILANHVIQCRAPGQLLQSNGLGCMGYALPAVIGAALACPDRPVVALIGDGCMLMTAGELALAAELRLPLVVVVLNDASLSLIKLKQAKMQLAPRAVDFAETRFDRLGEAFGAVGLRAETLEDFNRAFDAALASRRLTVIDAVINPDEYADQM